MVGIIHFKIFVIFIPYSMDQFWWLMQIAAAYEISIKPVVFAQKYIRIKFLLQFKYKFVHYMFRTLGTYDLL